VCDSPPGRDANITIKRAAVLLDRLASYHCWTWGRACSRAVGADGQCRGMRSGLDGELRGVDLVTARQVIADGILG
jgi:hypothetical protein